MDGEVVRIVDHGVRFGVGFTIPAAAGTYWVGEAMGKLDYDQAGPKPDTTGGTTKTLAANVAHLAAMLRASPYPAA